MGLERLEILRKTGRYLFQGDCRPDPVTVLQPHTSPTCIEPDRVRGVWISEVGLMPPVPLVRNLFASPVAAALSALTTHQGTERPATQLEAFSDHVVAMTFGENAASVGRVEMNLTRSSGLDDHEPTESLFINVVLRSALPPDRLGFPLPGEYVCSAPVSIERRIALTAGDLRALKQFLDRTPRPWMDDLANSCAPPFCGPFVAGGHLQFDSVTGELLRKHRRPLDSDRRSARIRAQEVGRRWVERWCEPMRKATEAACHRTVFEQVLSFVDENCSRPLTVEDIAARAGSSQGHLNRLFRRHVGMSPMAYVARKRLDLAERLLAETRLSVSEVADRCGFAEPSGLNHALKRLRGTTPSALRGGR